MEDGFDVVAIVGVGLIGGSIGQALRERGRARRVVGIVRRPETARLARERGAIDDATEDLRAGVAEADLVILCPPVLTIPDLAAAMAGALRPGTVVTDVGSTKEFLVREVTRRLPPACPFIGGHPMAGSERGGVEAARADLFVGATWVLCPGEGGVTSAPNPLPEAGRGSFQLAQPPHDDALLGVRRDEGNTGTPPRFGEGPGERSPLSRLASWVAGLGAVPVTMDAAEHDRVVAAISHLPHVAAAALVNAVATGGEEREALRTFIAGGFTSTTRIASSPPELWRDICLTNRAAVLRTLAGYRAALDSFEEALRREDGEALLAAFAAARAARDELIG
jgi:prephenate dehydrogenase